MSRGEIASKLLHLLGLPFRLLWGALTSVADLTRQQIRSLVTVAFLAGMISLSGENWAITFAADHATDRMAADAASASAFLGFLTERMRYISGLQAWLALILGAVILNADYLRFKHGDTEAELGNRATAPPPPPPPAPPPTNWDQGAPSC